MKLFVQVAHCISWVICLDTTYIWGEFLLFNHLIDPTLNWEPLRRVTLISIVSAAIFTKDYLVQQNIIPDNIMK
jgi:hypothetical protein